MNYKTTVAYAVDDTTKEYVKSYPISHVGAIYTKDDESELLKDKLTNIDENIISNSNKIGDLSGSGLLEADLATAIKNDRTQLSDMVSIGEFIIKYGNDSTAITNAISYCINNNKKLIISDGTYNISQDIIISSSIIIECTRNVVFNMSAKIIINSSNVIITGKPKLKPSSDYTENVFEINANLEIKKCKFDLEIYSDYKGSWTGIYINTSTGGIFWDNDINIYTRNCGKGIYLNNNGGFTSNRIMGSILNFDTGFSDTNTGRDVFSNTFKLSMQQLINQDSVAFILNNGFANQIDIEHWYDNTSGRYYAYDFKTNAVRNFIYGHVEGEILEANPLNIWNIWNTTRNRNVEQYGHFDNVKITNHKHNNLLQNGDMEAGTPPICFYAVNTNNISISRETINVYEGNASMKAQRLTTLSSGNYIAQQINNYQKYANKNLIVGVMAMCPTTNTGNMSVSIQDGVTVKYSEIIPNDGKWYKIILPFTVSSNPLALQIELGRAMTNLVVNDIAYFDNAFIIESNYPAQEFVSRNIEKIFTVSTLPTPDETLRGKLINVNGANGVADLTYICRKTATDTYEFKQLYT